MALPVSSSNVLGLLHDTHTRNALHQATSMHPSSLASGEPMSTATFPQAYFGADDSRSHHANSDDAATVEPGKKPRKKRAPTLPMECWEPYKDRIIELHIGQRKSLKEVKAIMEQEYNFSAGERQYRTRISQWGLDKNVKPAEMRAIVRKRQQRKILEPKKNELDFWVRGEQVSHEKIERWMKRNGISDSLVYAPSPVPSTPSAVVCRTISDRGSPPPSPTLSERSFGSDFGEHPFRDHTPTPYSMYPPTLAVSGVEAPACESMLFSAPGIPIAESISEVLRSPAMLPLELYNQQLDPDSVFADISMGLQFESTPGQPFMGVSMHLPSAEHHKPLQSPRYEQSEELKLHEELAHLRVTLGLSHPDTLYTLLRLGHVLLNQGRFETAGKVFHLAFNASNKAPEINSEIAYSEVAYRANLGIAKTWAYQGHYARSKELHQQVLWGAEKVLHNLRFKLEILHSFAHVLRLEGNFKEAEALAVEAVELRKGIVSQGDPAGPCLQETLAMIYVDQEQFDKAEHLILQVIDIGIKKFGENNIATLSTRTRLAEIYMRQGRLLDAQELLFQLEDTTTTILGLEHPVTQLARSYLAMVYGKLGNYEEAEELLLKAIHYRSDVLGPSHPVTTESIWNLAVLRNCQGKKSEALELAEACVRLWTCSIGANHPTTVALSAELNKWREEYSYSLMDTDHPVECR